MVYLDKYSRCKLFFECVLECHKTYVLPGVYILYVFVIIAAAMLHFAEWDCFVVQLCLLILPCLHYLMAARTIVLHMCVQDRPCQGFKEALKERYDTSIVGGLWFVYWLFVSDVVFSAASLFFGFVLFVDADCQTDYYDVLFYLAMGFTILTTATCIARELWCYKRGDTPGVSTSPQASCYERVKFEM